MVLRSKSSVRPLRVSPVQQIVTKLSQKLKEYSFGLKESLCEPQDLQLSIDTFQQNPPLKWTEFSSYMLKGKTTTQVKIDVVFTTL